MYYAVSGDAYMNIFITFSLSILLIYALQYFSNLSNKLFAYAGVLVIIVGAYAVNRLLIIDYGFFGCIAPVFAILLPVSDKNNIWRVTMFSAGIFLLAVTSGGIQYYSLLSIPLLMLYNGKRGKTNMKYFFYIFYPAHLLILQGIGILIKE